MFKKFGKSIFDKETQPPVHTFPDLANRPPNPFATDLMNALDPHAFEIADEEASQDEEPETVIAEGVSIKGTMSFQKLVRIDGSFEGELLSSGKVIVGPTGSLKANINLEEAFISGKVIGDITVKKRLVLRGRAEVRGDVTAPLLSVDEGVSIIGILNIARPETPIPDPIDDDHYSSDN
ncbi:MAG: polymer-forming cytoskeletal protein [Verrucomicrobia bacterium]|nr:polymer-forming cytoskeletal protein [Verrucomicrobiota bacterium]